MPEAHARALRVDEPETRPREPRRLRLVEAADADRPLYTDEGRRIVTISTDAPRRRPSRTASRMQSRPDRLAMWAVILGLLMVFMAVATAHASTF